MLRQVCDPNGYNTTNGCPAGQQCAFTEDDTASSCVECTPNCTGKVCGDDGCGGSCGTCSTSTPLCGVGGTQCVASLPGSCAQPCETALSLSLWLRLTHALVADPLFGSTLAPGHPDLLSADQEGLQYFLLNNVGLSTEPARAITTANRASLGLTSERGVPREGIRVRVLLNSAPYPNSVDPSSNGAGIPDVVFQFSIPASTPTQALDAYLLAQDGTTDQVDTFLVLMKPNCVEMSSLDPPLTPADNHYADDSSPPGGISSHVLVSNLVPGDYLLVVTSYSSSNAKPVWLEVAFTNSSIRSCTPVCRSRLCGPNQCGGVCNVQQCDSGSECRNGLCTACPDPIPANYTFNCVAPADENAPPPFFNTTYERQCGQDSDLCSASLQTCGTCPAGTFCQRKLGLCVAEVPCDSRVPVCPDAKPAGAYFCGSRCKWVELNAPLPDIVTQTLEDIVELSTTYLHWKFFDAISCSLSEGCVSAPGWQLVMRYGPPRALFPLS